MATCCVLPQQDRRYSSLYCVHGRASSQRSQRDLDAVQSRPFETGIILQRVFKVYFVISSQLQASVWGHQGYGVHSQAEDGESISSLCEERDCRGGLAARLAIVEGCSCSLHSASSAYKGALVFDLFYSS